MTLKQVYKVKGKTGTLKDLASYFGVVRGDVARCRVQKHGWSVEDAVTRPQERFVKTYSAFGMTGNLKYLVEQVSSVSEATVRARLKYGWDLEKALITPKLEGKDLTVKVCNKCKESVPIAIKVCYCGSEFK